MFCSVQLVLSGRPAEAEFKGVTQIKYKLCQLNEDRQDVISPEGLDSSPSRVELAQTFTNSHI